MPRPTLRANMSSDEDQGTDLVGSVRFPQPRSDMSDSMLPWNRQHVARFWDFEALRPEAETHYFAYHHGPALARFLSRVTTLAGTRVLDFGSGPGFLVNELLGQGAEVAACDYSPGSVAAARERFEGRPGWLGSHLLQRGSCLLPDKSFDVVCCVETIEHTLDDDLPCLFDEVRRLLRVNGLAVFTTPNCENLSRSSVFCANCGSVFHRWQHVRSWTPGLLRQELETRGYEVRFCDGLNVDAFVERQVKLSEISPGRVAREVRRVADRLFDAASTRDFLKSREFRRCLASHSRPHLVAVARRT